MLYITIFNTINNLLINLLLTDIIINEKGQPCKTLNPNSIGHTLNTKGNK